MLTPTPTPAASRVYLILHDPHVAADVDPIIIQRKMQAKFPPHHTKLLFINSLAPSAPNLQQPNMWSKFLIPTFFPLSNNSLVSFDPSKLPLNPMDGKPVYGAYLSMEDFMAIRNFCILLYQNEIVPSIERKIVALTKIVSDARKGVKNVLKSLWRKPREEASIIVKGVVRYRYDKIESQILQLADASFVIRDYDSALSLYKLVREDFKADKSNLHLAHVTVMTAMCLLITDAVGNKKEVLSNIETLMHILRTHTESLHLSAYFAVLAAEILLLPSINLPSEAAHVSVLAASKAVKSNVLSGLLTEKAAIFFLTAGFTRKYALHEVIAGYKFHSCTDSHVISSHALVCFATAMLIYEKEPWGDVKAKLYRIIAEDCRNPPGGRGSPVSGAQQKALLFLLRVIFTTLTGKGSSSGAILDSGDGSDSRGDIGGKNRLRDCVVALNDLITKAPWGTESVCDKDLSYLNTAQILLREGLFVESTNGGASTVLRDLSIPSVDITATDIIDNDSSVDMSNLEGRAVEREVINSFIIKHELIQKFVCERKMIDDCKNSSSASLAANIKKVAKHFYDIEVANYQLVKDMIRYKFNPSYVKTAISSSISISGVDSRRVAIGERLQLTTKLVNNLPIDMTVWNVSIGIERVEEGKAASCADAFSATAVEKLVLPAESETTVTLTAAPLQIGTFRVSSLNWTFSDNISVSETVEKTGKLLQKTAQNRLGRERQEDRSLYFTVVRAKPKLSIVFERPLPLYLLSHQIFQTGIVFRNTGCAPASCLSIKSQYPGVLFALARPGHSNSIESCGHVVETAGFSASIHPLPADVVIPPGESYRMECFLRFTSKRGVPPARPPKVASSSSGGNSAGAMSQKLSLLLSYASPDDPAASHYSYFNTSIGILPSISASFTTSSSTSDALSHALHCSVENCFAPSVESAFLPEGSEDAPSPTAAADSGSDLKITGMWIFGSARERVNLPDFVAAENISIGYGARYLLSVPVTSYYNSNYAIRSTFEGEILYSKYMAIDKVEHRLRSELQSLIVLNSSNKKGKKDRPRTIAQIRVDNEAISSSSDVTTIGSKDDDSESAAAAAGSDAVNDGAISAKSGSVVFDLFENFNEKFVVSLAFQVTVNGKIVKGLYNSSELTIGSCGDKSQYRALTNAFIETSPSNSSAQNSAIGVINYLCNNAVGDGMSELLFIALSHEKSVVLKPIVDKSSATSVTVPVSLTVFSRRSEGLSISIESIDSRNATALASLPHASQAQQPVRWQGKTKFVDVAVEGLGSTKVDFSCSISKGGIFDLNRFRVTARVAGSSEAPSVYTIPGVSLVDVKNIS